MSIPLDPDAPHKIEVLSTIERQLREAIVRLSESDSDWISGNVIGVDGGEFVTG